ncbi:hypothetical protein BD779DRAFT_1504608 [Infundibulicybe gibba]|nr:hypothetical protein BD779DRAFT_1504608 [Infundibulicybe gibba]
MPSHNITLESPTGRLRMVPPNPADDEVMASIRCHTVTRRYLQFLPTVITAEDVRIRREARAENPQITDFYLYVKERIFNVYEENESCDAGLIDRKLHRVTLDTSVDNTPMRGWLEKVAGIRLEANRTECWKIRPGEYCDVVGYALLDWEWRDRVKAALERRMNINTGEGIGRNA